MFDILSYWTDKGVDAFRCDMVEYVPFEFWGWLIPKLKEKYPYLQFIGEAYNPQEYGNYLFRGHFDYLYDKVGLYDVIKRLTKNENHASAWDINAVWNHHTRGFDERMLRFMENHDETRIASEAFAGNAWHAVPGMIVTATLSTGPVMIYSGQEVGEPASGSEGFSGNDGRTTIFDYWSMPEYRKWVNNGRYDGGQLSAEQKQLREFYSKLLNLCRENEALCEGAFYELMMANEHQSGFNNRLYIYLRYTGAKRVLAIVNFNREQIEMAVLLPKELLSELNLRGKKAFTDLLTAMQFTTDDVADGVSMQLPAMGGYLLEF